MFSQNVTLMHETHAVLSRGSGKTHYKNLHGLMLYGIA